MKATELCVGDIVLIDGKPTRIAAVHLSKVGWHSRKDKLTWTRIGLVQPILLTREVFGRNGWRCVKFSEYVEKYYLTDDYCELAADEFSDGVWRVSYDCLEMGNVPYESVNIFWLHELQHFLRRHGIGKEIVMQED